MHLEKIVSEIFNNVVSGLPGLVGNTRFTQEQVEETAINERLAVIKEYALKNMLPKDLYLSIRCLEVDCKNVSECCGKNFGTPTQHFELPQTFNDLGEKSIDFIGSTDNVVSFTVYTDDAYKNHKHRRRGANDPYVWVDTTPNARGYYDVYVFNAPFLKLATVRAIFKDPRQLQNYGCCTSEEYDNFSYIHRDVIKRVTETYIRYYRQMAQPMTPNDQQIK